MDQEFIQSTGPGISFEWTQQDRGDFVVIVAQLLGDGGATPLELVSCVARDDGSFSMPADIWEQWAYGDLILVEFGRVIVSERTLPHNRANVEIAGIAWKVGALATN